MTRRWKARTAGPRRCRGQVDWREVTEGLGTRFEAALNTYKPFACGIVAHPAIDAAIQLRNEYSFPQATSTQSNCTPIRWCCR